MGHLAYKKWQILLGTLFGGPVAAVYFIKKNFDAMGNVDQSKKTITIGLALIAALVAIVPFLPDFIPSIVYSVAYAAGAQSIYIQQQESTLKDNPRYSHWNVAGVAVVSLITLLAVGFPLVYAYYEFGILTD